jgi:hypothetical protein
MAIRLGSRRFVCLSPARLRRHAEILAPFGDDAALSIGFPPSTASPDATTSEVTLEPGAIDDMATSAPDRSLDPSSSAAPGDEADEGAAEEIADSSQVGACRGPLSSGDLVLDELMIDSGAGAGDEGEWLEVRTAPAGAVNVLGLHENVRAAPRSSLST